MQLGQPTLEARSFASIGTDEQAWETRKAVVHAARAMRRAGLTVGSLGNVSIRTGARICVTPTRVLAADLSPEEVVVVDLEGRQETGGAPSGELPLHLEVYRRNPSLRAVVHTHSPWATAWSHLQAGIPGPTQELSYYRLGLIPCAQWAPAGSGALARRAADALEEAPVILLARHGVVGVGGSAGEALERCALAEHQAQIQWLLRLAPADRGGGVIPRARRTASRTPKLRLTTQLRHVAWSIADRRAGPARRLGRAPLPPAAGSD
jgi:L-fuculose-phosphate aldolase